MSEGSAPATRTDQLDRSLAGLLGASDDIEAAAVVSFDGLPMASALPAGMAEDRVAAMSAALLSLGERASEGLGRGALSQVYIEGERGTVFLVACGDEAVLVAVARRGAKAGLVLYEARQAAAAVQNALRPGGEPVLPAQSGAHAVPASGQPAAPDVGAGRDEFNWGYSALSAPLPSSVPDSGPSWS